MAYVIMRCKKHSGMGTIAAALQHNFRERETPNADPTRTPQNIHAVTKSTDEAMGRLRDRLPETDRRGRVVRKDAVRCVEYLMTASPEWMQNARKEDQTEFFRQSVDWLKEKYGRENVVAITVQYDETTPHMSAFVVPVDREGYLNAKSFVGGKEKLSRDQTTFAERMKHLGLERGIEGSKAKHTSIQQYYRLVNAPEPRVEIPWEREVVKKGLLTTEYESDQAFAKRVADAVRTEYEPYRALAVSSETLKRNLSGLKFTLKTSQRRLQELSEPFIGLTSLQKGEILDKAREIQAENNLGNERDKDTKTEKGFSR